MKNLQDICLANPLKVQIAKVQFECTSDYDHFAGRRDAAHYVIYPLTTAIDMWRHPLGYVEKHEQIHRYTNDGLIHEDATGIAAKAPEEMKTSPEADKQSYDPEEPGYTGDPETEEYGRESGRGLRTRGASCHAER